jgi:hypothetical protein
MKREFFETFEVGGAKFPKEIIDAIMAENGKDIEALKAALAEKEAAVVALTTERDGLSTQIKDRDKDIKALREQAGNSEALNKQLTDLQGKYDTDTAALQKQLTDQSFTHATDKFFSGVEFASELAKKAAISDFKEQGFKFGNDGKCEPGAAWLEALKKSDPAAFKVKESEPADPDGNQNQQGGGNPFFVAPTGNQNPQGGGDAANPFSFSFSGVRPAPETTKK